MKSRGKKREQPENEPDVMAEMDETMSEDDKETINVEGTITVEDTETENDAEAIKSTEADETSTTEGTVPEKSSNEVRKKVPRKVPIPKCPEDREYCKSCQAYQNGRCIALEDVTFKDNKCSFYKEQERARAERIAAMEKLEDTGRRDLIRKYYGHKFDRVLGNELVGESYRFDDYGCVYVDEEEAAVSINATEEGTESDDENDSEDDADGEDDPDSEDDADGEDDADSGSMTVGDDNWDSPPGNISEDTIAS